MAQAEKLTIQQLTRISDVQPLSLPLPGKGLTGAVVPFVSMFGPGPNKPGGTD